MTSNKFQKRKCLTMNFFCKLACSVSFLLAAGAVWAGTAPLSSAADPAAWRLNLGETPGATARLERDAATGVLLIRAGFTGESAYVGAIHAPELPPGVTKLNFRVTADRELEAGLRLLDASGRNFQTERFKLASGRETTLPLKLDGTRWEGAWGGSTNASRPVPPIREIQLLLNRPAEPEVTVRLAGVELEAPFINARPFTGENFRLEAFGCTVTGNWRNGAAPVLELAISALAEAAGEVVLTFPEMFRDQTARFAVEPGRTARHLWKAPLTLGGNPFNTYRIGAALRLTDGSCAERAVLLRGADSPDWERRLKSSEVTASILGTGTHFCFAPEPTGGYAAWYPYERLMDKIAAAGLKWVRDDYWMRRPDGTPGATPQQLARLRAAKAHGLNTIAMLPTMADQTLDYFLENVRAFVTETRGLVDVYEIGNEPNNFGGWIQKYGGTWNAREKDNSTSRWLIEHAKYVNAAADLIRELKPDAVVISGGYVTSSILRFLKNGISPNLNGITDHPYSAMTPPELYAFGTPFDGRDGVKAGGPNLHFSEVVQAFLRTFREIGRPDLSLWYTEFGYTTYLYGGQRKKGKYTFAAYTEEAQAVYLVRRYLYCFTRPEIKAALQYDFLDDFQGRQFDPEANFGLLRADYSPKPAYFALQNLATFFNGVRSDSRLDAQVKIDDQPLHRAGKRGQLLDWDEDGKALMNADNNIHARLFQTDGGLRLAVWDARPVGGEFSPRFAEVRIAGKAASAGKTVGLDLLSGKRFDVPSFPDGNDLILKLSIGSRPLAVTLF